MKTKKSPNADLERIRFVLLEVGLVLALGFILLAFEWRTTAGLGTIFPPHSSDIFIEDDLPFIVPDMVMPPPPPPPPINHDFINVFDDAVELPADPDLFKFFEADLFDPNLFPPPTNTVDPEVDEEKIFIAVERKPSFRGDFRAYLANNLNYPEYARNNGIQGRVALQFVVEPDGSISNVKVLRGVDPLLDREAARVIEASPRWNPGIQLDKPVRVYFEVIISFALHH